MHPRHGGSGTPAPSVGGSQCLRLLVPPTPHQQGRGAGRSRSETTSVRSPSKDETRGGWHRRRQSLWPLLEAAPLGGIMSRSRFLPPSPASSRLVSVNVVTTGSSAAQCAPPGLDSTWNDAIRVHCRTPRHSAGPSVGALGARRKPSSLVRLLRLDSNRRVAGHDPFGRRSNT
jgi:hypothetical protein